VAAKKPSSLGLPVYIAGGFFVIGIALFGYLQFHNRGPAPDLPLSDEAKAYVHNQSLTLEDVTMKATESYVKQNLVEIEGKIGNAGGRPVDSV
jgi:hypothetical protein